MKGAVFLAYFLKYFTVVDACVYFTLVSYDLFIVQQFVNFRFVIKNHFAQVKMIIRLSEVVSFIEDTFPGKPGLEGFQQQHFI